MAVDPAPPKAAMLAFVPLSTYQNFDTYWERLVRSGSKSPSTLALQSLAHSKPDLAKTIFENAVMQPFMRLLQTNAPGISELSAEATRRIDDLRGRFLQETPLVLMQLEAIFVIELVDPHARSLVHDMSHGRMNLDAVRASEHRHFANKVEATSAAYAQINLVQYVHERENRIMLELVHAIDGRPVNTQVLELFETMPNLKELWRVYGDGSFIGEDGVNRIASWVFGHLEF